MKIKISELSGIALDWAVAQCEGTASYGPEDFREQRKVLTSLSIKKPASILGCSGFFLFSGTNLHYMHG